MEFGSKFVYLGNLAEDDEVVVERNGVVVSDSEFEDSDDDSKDCHLSILDTAGHEEYSSIRDLYLHTADGFVIIYSITDSSSFREAEAIFNWLVRLRETSPYTILVANKQDMLSEDTIRSQAGQDLAEKLAVPFFETSAKTGHGVTEAMIGLIKLIPRTSKHYKIVMLGSGAVGKSSITFRFIKNTFKEYYDPTIEDTYHKIINVQGLQKISKKKSNHAQTEGNAAQASDSRRDRNVLRKLCSCFKFKGSRKKNPSAAHSAGASRCSDTETSPPGTPTPPGTPSPPGTPRASSSSDTETSATSQSAAGVKIKVKKIDANVVLIPLRILRNEPNLMTGDPITCAQCRAVLTNTSILKKKGKSWTCEFCRHINCDLDISKDEVPKDDSIDFILMPPPTPIEQEDNVREEAREVATSGVTVYCMDVSGSMTIQCEVPESVASWQAVRTHGWDTVYQTTRLSCIKKAIQGQIEQLKKKDPSKQVLLVVFDGNVSVMGGGKSKILPVYQQLARKSFQDLLQLGIELSGDYPLQSIGESFQSMSKAVESLKPGRHTALGPALSICAGYVSNKPGSEIVLCTDGEPNVGVGDISLRGPYRDEFYKIVGEYARSKNITINILAVGEESVQLRTVSEAAEISGGLTNLLNPVEMMRQLRLIAQNEMIAIAVSVRFYLHPNFTFDEIGYGENVSRFDKEVGNVRKKTELTFRFKLYDSKKSESQGMVFAPFQVQITYTRPDGKRYLRVLSKALPATYHRRKMEQNIDVSVLTVAAMKATANMAKAGRVFEAQHYLKNVKRLINRGAVTLKQKHERLRFLSRMEGWERPLTFSPNDFSYDIDDSSYSVLLKAVNVNSFWTESGDHIDSDESSIGSRLFLFTDS